MEESQLACEDIVVDGILAGADLAIAPGGCTALVGPTGAGKTTLLWVMAGLVAPQAGTVTRRGRIGMVFQRSALWDHLTVEQHLRVVGADPTARRALLERTRLDTRAGRRPGELSGGEQQRLALARALAVEPDWLLLDEPMAHLDGPSRRAVFDLLAETIAATDAGVVLATHRAREALSLADRIAVIDDGRIVQTGTPQQVYDDPVSLVAATSLGEASDLDGAIVRPERVAFEPDDAGTDVVRRCDFAGDGWSLRIARGATTVGCRSDTRVAPGTRGSVRAAPPG